ncbi:MAG: NAD-dependent epimerase/dehydratase family protein [Polyangiales bacterium]
MHTLVAGASGFVGSHIARLLVQRGRNVRVMLRKTSNTAALRGLDVEVVHGDVLDPESLLRAFEGCGSVFYSVVDPRFWLSDPTPVYRNNVEGLVNAMEAALCCDVQRFVFTSSIGTLGLNPHGPVTEDLPFNWLDRASPYIRARLEAETKLLTYCRERGLPGIALCVANTYGPDDYQPTPHNEMLWKVADGQVRFALDAGAPMVDIRDVAEAALLAEQHGRVGERYIIANEFLSNRAFYGAAVAHRGQKPPSVIPLRFAHAVAWIAERIFALIGKKDAILGTDAVFLSNAFQAMDNGKARRELHWEPRPAAETIRDAVAWFAEQARES